VVSACRPAGTAKAVPERDAEQAVTPHDVALLAHELRRRMAAMRMLGEAVSLLRSQDLDPGAMLERLMGELDDLDGLAAAVLGDGRYRGSADGAPGAEVVTAVRAAARTVAAARGATVRVDADGPVEVRASATMLRQAVENLIDNAAVHGGPGGVEVGVKLDPAAGQVEVVVADRGTAQRSPDGHGMGLFLVRRFLDDAGGRCSVGQRPGGGTVVTLGLPVRPVEAAGQDPLDTAVNT
jgi:two-component system, OmpR family, sensor kinase